MLEVSQRWFGAHRREWVGISNPASLHMRDMSFHRFLTLDRDLGTNLPKTLRMTIFNNE